MYKFTHVLFPLRMLPPHPLISDRSLRWVHCLMFIQSETCLKRSPTVLTRYCPPNKGVPSIQVHFIENKGRKIGLETEAGVDLVQGVRLRWGPLNTVFTSVVALVLSPPLPSSRNFHNIPCRPLGRQQKLQ